MATTTIKIDLGKNAADARQGAIEAAGQLYKACPTGDARGQTFKNEFTAAFLGQSERAAKAAKAFLGSGSPKPVDAEPKSANVEEDDHVCCKCCK